MLSDNQINDNFQNNKYTNFNEVNFCSRNLSLYLFKGKNWTFNREKKFLHFEQTLTGCGYFWYWVEFYTFELTFCWYEILEKSEVSITDHQIIKNWKIFKQDTNIANFVVLFTFFQTAWVTEIKESIPHDGTEAVRFI